MPIRTTVTTTRTVAIDLTNDDLLEILRAGLPVNEDSIWAKAAQLADTADSEAHESVHVEIHATPAEIVETAHAAWLAHQDEET
jgi:hypothetical protein